MNHTSTPHARGSCDQRVRQQDLGTERQQVHIFRNLLGLTYSNKARGPGFGASRSLSAGGSSYGLVTVEPFAIVTDDVSTQLETSL